MKSKTKSKKKIDIYKPVKISASHYYRLENENNHYLIESIIRNASVGFKEKNEKFS